MELHELRCFVAVAEELHFRRAAARLHLSPSAVTVAVRRLERTLRCSLLHRTTRSVELTPAGRDVLVQARGTLAAVAAIEEPVTRDPAELRVGVLDEGIGEHTALVLAAYRARYPGVPLRVRALSYPEAVGAQPPDVDILLAHGPLEAFDGHREVLGHRGRMLMVMRGHRLAEAPELALADVLDEPFLDVPGLRPRWLDAYRLVPERNGERPRPAPAAPRTFADVQWAILTGAVLSVLDTAPLFFAHPDIRYVPLPDAQPIDFGVVVPHGRGDARTRAFLAEARRVTGDRSASTADR